MRGGCVALVLVALTVVRALPFNSVQNTLESTQENVQTCKDGNCVSARRQLIGCSKSIPPQLHAPIIAFDDDREQHMEVSWPPAPEEYGVDTYRLTEIKDGAFMGAIYEGPRTLWTSERYAKSSSYEYSVVAVNCAGQSEASDSVTIRANEVEDLPRTPRVGEVTPSSIALRWFPNVDNPAFLSVLEHREASGPPPTGTSSSHWTDWQRVYTGPNSEAVIGSLRPNRWYWFRLTYMEDQSTRTWSKVVGAQTLPDVPETPRTPTLAWLDRKRTNANVTWPAAINGGRPITAYTLQMISDIEDEPTVVHENAERYARLTLTPGRKYTFRLRASNELGHSDQSGALVVLCPPHVPAAPPAPVLVGKSPSSVKVRWHPASFDGGAEITHYELEQGDGLGMSFHQIVADMAFTHESTGLLRNTHYRFRVMAVNSVGASEPSEILLVQTKRVDGVCPGGEIATGSCFGFGQCDVASQNCTCDYGRVLEDCSGLPCPGDCTSPQQGVCNYGTGHCECLLGYQGVDCSYQDNSHLCPEVCVHGACNKASGQCRCYEGYAGDTCEEYDCLDLNQCNERGHCASPGQCECSEGYLLPDCAKPVCVLVADCSGHGTCTSPNVCECSDAYFGASCGSSLCGPGDCNGNGVCVGQDKCRCEEGYAGSKCAVPVCPNDCSGHGMCSEPGQCNCEEGWVGNDCSIALCTGVKNCNGRGDCTAPDVCTCHPGWGGPECETFACEADCNHKGQCVGPLNCVCDRGWNGPACLVPDCDLVNECSGNGNCTAPNVCGCIVGWAGKQCETPLCDRVKGCMGHGRCIYPQVCDCDDGFAGSECEQRTKPTNSLSLNLPVDSLDFTRPLLSGLKQFTVEGWFNISGVGNRINLVVQRDLFEVFVTRKYKVGEYVPLDASGNKVNPMVLHVVLVTPKGTAELTRELPVAGERVFQYLAVTVDPDDIQLYLNGGVLGSISTPGNGRLNALGSSEFTLTAGGGVSDPRADDSPLLAIAALRVYSAVRTLGDVQLAMSAQSEWSESPELLGFWKFDDSFGAYAGDTSTKQNTARLIGEPEFKLVRLPLVKAPQPPQMVEHEVVGGASIRVMWEAPEDNGGALVTRYVLQQSSDFVNYDPVYDGPDLEAVVGNLAPARFYAFRVVAFNFVGPSETSPVSFMGTTPGPPFAPHIAPKLAEATSSSLIVSWSRAKCNGSLLTDYSVDYLESRTELRVIGAEVTVDQPRRAELTGLLPGRTYRVRVRGVNEHGAGAWSVETLMDTLAAPPTAPQWGVPRAEADSVHLTWVLAPSNGDAVRRHEIERAVHHARQVTPLAAAPPAPASPAQRHARARLHMALQRLAGTTLLQEHEGQLVWERVGLVSGAFDQWTDKTARPAMQYVYRLRAVNDAGAGEWTQIMVQTNAAPPDPPLDVTTSKVAKTSAVVVWRRPSANGPAITGYRVDFARMGPSPEWATVYEGTQMSAPLKGLAVGTPYLVRVAARNCKGWGQPAGLTVLTVTVPPEAPGRLVLRKVTAHAVVLEWTHPHLNGASAATYVLEKRTGNAAWAEAYTGAELRATVRDLVPNTQYDFRVAGVTTAGVGQFTKQLSVSTRASVPGTLAAPTISNLTHVSMRVSWEEPPDHGHAVQGYEVYAGPREALELHVVYEGPNTTALVPGLAPDTPYRIRIRSLNAAGASDYTEVEVTTLAARVMAPPPPVAVAKNATSMVLAWPLQDNPALAIDAPKWQLEVFVRPEGATDEESAAALAVGDGFQSAYSGSERRAEVLGLSPGRMYHFRLRGADVYGPGPASQVVSFATPDGATAPDSPPLPVLTKAEQSTLTLTWRPADVAGSIYATHEYVVEATQPIPWDVSLDNTTQGALLPTMDEDPRLARIDVFDPEAILPEFHEVARVEARKAVVRGLLPGHAYGIRIRAINAANSSVSAAVMFHTLASVPMALHAPDLVSRSASEIRIEWDRPADGGSEILSYAVVIDNTTRVEVQDTRRYYVAKGLEPGTTHSFAVAAANALGETIGLTAEYSTLAGPPKRPNRPEVSTGPLTDKGGSTIKVRWGLAEAVGAPVTGYTLEMRDPLTMTYAPVVSNMLVLSAQVSDGVLPAQEYAFRVLAHSAAGVSEVSEPALYYASASVPEQMPPPRVEGVTATSIALAWDDLTPGQNEYEIRAGKDADSLSTVYSGVATSLLLKDLAPDSNFVIQLRSVTGKGAGPWSDELLVHTETHCLGDDGAVCSGRGECVQGRCECFRLFTGARCEMRLTEAVCGAYGAGHVLTLDGQHYVTSAVGEHVMFAVDQQQQAIIDSQSVTVHTHRRPLAAKLPHMTGVDAVAIKMGPHTLSLATSRRAMRASNNLYVRLNCGPSVAMDIRRAFEEGLEISDSPFKVRVDAAKRFVVAVEGSGVRVVVHPWLFQDRYFLNAYVVDVQPGGTNLERGLCGQMSGEDGQPLGGAVLKPIIRGSDGLSAAATWVDQWLVDSADGITQCPEDTNPAFDTTDPVVAPVTAEPTVATDMAAADTEIMSSFLEADPLPDTCTADTQRSRARQMCQAMESVAEVGRACVWDYCAADSLGNHVLASHSDAHRTLSAIESAIESRDAAREAEEQAAREDGSLTNNQQQIMPVCPQ